MHATRQTGWVEALPMRMAVAWSHGMYQSGHGSALGMPACRCMPLLQQRRIVQRLHARRVVWCTDVLNWAHAP